MVSTEESQGYTALGGNRVFTRHDREIKQRISSLYFDDSEQLAVLTHLCHTQGCL
jgi:hypothetical protein